MAENEMKNQIVVILNKIIRILINLEQKAIGKIGKPASILLLLITPIVLKEYIDGYQWFYDWIKFKHLYIPIICTIILLLIYLISKRRIIENENLKKVIKSWIYFFSTYSLIIGGIASYKYFTGYESYFAAFKTTDNNFKILILPFNKECAYEGKSYDIGYVLKKRIEKINVEDTLDVKAFYLSTKVEYLNFTTKQFDSILNYHHADMIIYGSYSLKQCEADIADKVCFNYRTDEQRWSHISANLYEDPSMKVLVEGLESIRNGSVQEKVEQFIYKVAGISSYSNKKYKRAIHQLRKINSYDNQYEILFFLGASHINMRQFDSAKLDFQKLTINFSDSSRSWELLGFAYQKLGMHDSAYFNLNKALDIDSTNFFAWDYLGHYYEKVQDFDSAQLSYHCAAYYSADIHILDNLVRLSIKTKRYETAEEYLLLALEEDKKNPYYLGKLAVIYNLMKKNSMANEYFSRAKLSYRRILNKYPDDIAYLREYGFLLLEVGKEDEGVEILSKVLHKNKHDSEVSARLGEYYISANDYQKAKNYSDASLLVNPENYRALITQGGYYFHMQKFDSAKSVYQRVIAIDSTIDENWRKLGDAYLKLKDNRYLYCYRKAIALDINKNSDLLKADLRRISGRNVIIIKE